MASGLALFVTVGLLDHFAMGVVLTGVSSVAVGMAGGLPVGTKKDAFDLAALLVVPRDVFMLVGKLMLGAQAITRLQAVLEDTHLPLASGVTDRYGIFARRMLEVLITRLRIPMGPRSTKRLCLIAPRAYDRRCRQLDTAVSTVYHARIFLRRGDHHAGLPADVRSAY